MTGERPPGLDPSSPSLVTAVTCPECGSEAEERMPEDACVVVWNCPECGAELRPRPGDCCVFCSHGSTPCPPEQGDGGR